MTGQQQNSETREALKGMEYTLRRYFEENFVPILDEETKTTIRQAESAKSELMFGSLGNVYESGLGREPYGYKPSEATIEMSKKTLDDAYDKSVERFLGTPAFQQDLSFIAEGYRITLIQELGEDRYKQLSEQLKSELGDSSSGDLAADYVEHRLEQLAIERLAQQGMPSSSLGYFFNKGLLNSAAGMFYSASQRNEGNLEAAAKEMREKMYGANCYEKAGSKVVEYVVDALTFGTGFGAKALLKLSCLEGGLFVTEKAIDKLTENSKRVVYDEYFSEIVYGDKTVLPQLQKESKVLDATESKIVEVMNENLQNKVTAFKSFAKPIDFKSMAMGEIPTPDYSLQPKEEKKEERPEGVPLVIAPGKEEEYLEAKAAEEAAKKASEQNTPTTKDGRPLETYSGPRGTYVMMTAQQNNMGGYPQGQMPRQQSFIQQQEIPFSPKQEMMNGWRGLTDMLGLTGMSDLGRNSGYVLAMLPDMIMGMFTGKYKSLRFEDNVLPVASILVGMFVKNPILKFLLIAMGGANLLNKAGHEALEKAGYQPARQYRKYENQELSDRIKDVAIKGDTLLATIDGVPQMITITSEKTLDAYYKGLLPINTLANAVLDKYDEQNKSVISSYERGMEEGESQRRVVGIK